MTRLTQCIVHAGTHKTGTTTVQDVLAAHRADLTAAGFFYPAMDRKGRDHNPLAHRLATCADDDLLSIRDELRGQSAKAGLRPGNSTTLLLSAEELSTRICNPDPWAGFDDGAYWDRRNQYLTRFRRVLPERARIETFICFRDHESYAHALYATKVLNGRVYWPFAEFVSRCAPIFDYRRQVDVLADALGPVRIESYEQLRGDLVNRVFAWLGVPIEVQRAPRLNPTPTMALVHWLAKAVQSQAGRAEHKLRAKFCLAYRQKPGEEGPAVHSLWQSERERQDFLGRCHAPPLDLWPSPPATGRIADAAVLDRCSEEIEAEYHQWLRDGGHRKHWIYFWRRL